tara:strand:+ start:617 stop:1273 length:657 start_codon:yes stop_codon:yes gene_type:complete
MKKEKVLIVGSSGHSKVIIDIFEKMSNVSILGLIDANRPVGSETLGYKILGSDDIINELFLKDQNIKIFVAIGDNFTRYKVVKKIKSLIPDIEFISAIHPNSIIGKNVKIGKGVAIMAGVIVNSDSIISDFCILNTNASLDHDNVMEKYSSLAPNSVTGGDVKIGEFSSISISATIKHGISIGEHSIIGAGSVLLNNCPNNMIFYGIPAREIRKREAG